LRRGAIHLSETSTGVVRARRRAAPQTDWPVLPQWALDIIRPILGLLSRLCWRVQYRGLENTQMQGSGFIIAANHQTYIDPFWVSIPVRRPMRFLAWDESFGWPIVGKPMGLLGAWPIQLDKGDPAAIRRSIQWLRDGGAIVMFPEGGRGLPDGSMIKFKNGAVRMALEAGVPILPATIRGGHRVWPKGKRLPCFSTVEIIYHPAFHVDLTPGEETRAGARRESDRLADIINSAL
jgi:1-acyl-sn-glycerol-3-phosphate acyltransferase